VIDDTLVPVIATQLGVAVRGLDFEHAVADLQERDVERSSTEVEHQDRLIGPLLVQPVGQCSSGGFVDDAKHFEARDGTGLLRGLALGVVEVGRNRDHRLGDGISQVGLGVSLQLGQDLGTDLLCGPGLAVHVEGPRLVAHVALDRTDGPVGVGDRLALRNLSDQDLVVLREPHDRRGGAGAFRVGDDDGLARLQNGDHGVRRSQVDTYCSCHVCLLEGPGTVECLRRVEPKSGSVIFRTEPDRRMYLPAV
jgi:hypothetical protein